MESPPQTPKQLAAAFYAIMPHAVTPGVLEDYGIEATPDQARDVTREVLSLNLFYIHSALDALLTAYGRDRVLEELGKIIETAWSSDLCLTEQDRGVFAQELDARRAVYQAIVEGGGQPVAVFSETTSILESGRAIRSEDRMKALALLIDSVPVDAYGDLVDEAELTDA